MWKRLEAATGNQVAVTVLPIEIFVDGAVCPTDEERREVNSELDSAVRKQKVLGKQNRALNLKRATLV